MIRSMQRWNSWTQAQATKVHEALVHEWRVWSCRQVSEWQEVKQLRAYGHMNFDVLTPL